MLCDVFFMIIQVTAILADLSIVYIFALSTCLKVTNTKIFKRLGIVAMDISRPIC